VATRGGTRLEPALASVTWARERAVLDPSGQVTPARLPPDVRLGGDGVALEALGGASWLLLLGEHEVAVPAMARAVAASDGGEPAAWSIPVEVETLGTRLTARIHPVRLAPRVGSHVALDRTLELELSSPAAPRRRLDAVLRAKVGESVAAAVDALVPESRALATLLAQAGRTPRALAVAGDPLAAFLRTLGAHAPEPAGLARWVAAVFAGYRVALTHAMLWEWQHARPAPVRVVA